MSASDLLTSAALASKLLQTPPPGLEQNFRWLKMTVVNQTQFSLSFVGHYFESGRFWTPPSMIAPFDQMTFSACTDEQSTELGVGGAIALQLDVAENLACHVGVGFANETAGFVKATVAFDPDNNQRRNSSPTLSLGNFTQGTYNHNSVSMGTATSAQYSGTDTNGQAMVIRFQGVSTPGQEGTVIITQQIVIGG